MVKKGFTLIELLVVIAIIAILAAILFPVFTAVKNRAKAIACLNSTKQVGTAHQMYMDAYDGHLVPIGMYLTSATGTLVPAPNGQIYWPDILAKYAKSGSIYRCAMAPKNTFGVGMNHPMLGKWLDATNKQNNTPTLSSIAHPSKTVCFADTGYITSRTMRNHNADAWEEIKDLTSYDARMTIAMRDPTNKGYFDQPNSATRIVGRHSGRANCMFLDGHAAAMTPSSLGYGYDKQDKPYEYGDPNVMWDDK